MVAYSAEHWQVKIQFLLEKKIVKLNGFDFKCLEMYISLKLDTKYTAHLFVKPCGSLVQCTGKSLLNFY